MSSPASRRSQRNSQSATPRRSVRGSQPIASSPLGNAANDQLLSEASQASQPEPVNGTPQNQLNGVNGLNAPATSSPMFFRSSSVNAANGQTRADVTPRASRPGPGESSPIRYMSSSSPTRTRSQQQTNGHFGSSSSGLFVRSPDGQRRIQARDRRGDISSDLVENSGRRRPLVVDENGRPIGEDFPSNAATFSNLNPDTSEANELSGAGQDQRLLWGTTVTQSEVNRIIEDFLLNFERRYRMKKEGELDNINGLPQDHPGRERVYVEMMKQMLELGVTTLNLDMKNLRAYPPTLKLWHQFQDYPAEVVNIFDNAIKALMIDLAEKKAQELRRQGQQNVEANARARHSSSAPLPPSSDIGMQGQAPLSSQGDDEAKRIVDEVELRVYRVRPFNLDDAVNLRDLNPADIDRVIGVKGLVIRTTPVIPDMKDAFFQCTVCGATQIVEIDKGKIAEPTECPREVCKAANSMSIVHNRSGFADKQVIKLQETPDNVPDGQTPHSVSICAYNELVDFCKAGDRIEVTGIFKCNPVRVNPRQRTVKSVYKTFVDALHIQKTDKKRLGQDITTIEQDISEDVARGTEEARKITEEEEERIKATAARPDAYELLARSLAPSIYELDDVKKGILLQLFGGTNKSFEKGGNPKYRGDINVLLCGDPSTAKSQLLQYVHKIAPRGVYTSGKGSSAVGLTAYVTRDPETRQLVLESGALVLSDGGVCCIDEFDKMSDSTRSVLHEVMEQQTVSIAKAGIITTLNARTSILASANPIGSKYNPDLPVPQNIDLPPTLLSRFDLVYLVLDRIEESNDRRLAKHLVGMYLEDTPENASANEVLPLDFLTTYITYARTQIHPTLTSSAQNELVTSYVSMRKMGEDIRASERRITATTRQLESMIRLAEAHAKMRLSTEVTADDVREAVRLIKSALKTAATDSRTGLIDMSLLTEGVGSGDRRRKQDLKDAVLRLLDESVREGGGGGREGNVRYAELTRRLNEGGGVVVEADELAEAIRALSMEGALQVVGDGPRRSVRRVVAV